MWLFHSVEKNDLSNKEDYRRKLLDHFDSGQNNLTVWTIKKLNNLDQQIKETPNKNPNNAPHPFDSWFEVRVFHKIARGGSSDSSTFWGFVGFL